MIRETVCIKLNQHRILILISGLPVTLHPPPSQSVLVSDLVIGDHLSVLLLSLLFSIFHILYIITELLNY